MEQAKRTGEIGRAAERRYTVLPRLEDHVEVSDATEVFSEWTGTSASQLDASWRARAGFDY